MFREIQNLLTTRDPNKQWLLLLIVLGIILFLILLYKRQNLTPYYEGFSQDSRFTMKRDLDVYDDLYVEIYDRLMLPNKRCNFEADKIIAMTQPSKKHSVFLDVGSGTGHLAGQLQKQGYSVFGIDKSPAMVAKSEKSFPDVQVKCGDATNEPMLYERGTFTHILCMGMTIYQFSNKMDFFRNCYFWLMSGGYLVLNLVDLDKFDTIIPGGKPPVFKSPQQYAKKRITDTIIDFLDFEYKGSYDFSNTGNSIILKETFTDTLTKNVRQNEMTLHMEKMDQIMKMATYCGFIAQGQANMQECTGDEYQYICILERPQ